MPSGEQSAVQQSMTSAQRSAPGTFNSEKALRGTSGVEVCGGGVKSIENHNSKNAPCHKYCGKEHPLHLRAKATSFHAL